MLLYVTTDEGRERKARPLHTIPDTVTLLYDLGMREHDRAALLLHPEPGGWGNTPDWRFDREVIRIALYLVERLNVAAGSAERVAILGPLRPCRLSAEFAVLGLGGVAVGLSQGLSDDEVVAALGEAKSRVAVATDAESATRLLRLRGRAPALQAVIGPEAGTEEKAFHPLARVLDMGATLDTAERAATFREGARALAPEHPACWHYGAPGESPRLARLTHRDAMARVRGHLRRLPAAKGDLAYFEGEAAVLESRFAWYAFAGDGFTTMAIGRPGRASEDVRDLRPAKILATPGWIAELRERVESAPQGGLERFARRSPGLGWLHAWARGRRVKRTVRERAGERLRWIQPLGVVPPELKGALAPAVTVVESAGPIPVSGPETPGGRPAEAAASEAGAEKSRLRSELT